MEKTIRVLIAKPGLDGHDRGAKVIASALRDAGMEVIYLGLRQTPEMIVNAAIQEDVDVISLSILSGAHMTIFPEVLDLMKQEKIDDVLLTGGGIIPEKDMSGIHHGGCPGMDSLSARSPGTGRKGQDWRRTDCRPRRGHDRRRIPHQSCCNRQRPPARSTPWSFYRPDRSRGRLSALGARPLARRRPPASRRCRLARGRDHCAGATGGESAPSRCDVTGCADAV